jgi:hypothetical protein
VAYLASDCPLDLAPDEAHYWDWSRHLDWSYYSKGPLVAYLIRAGTDLAGSWSRTLMGNEMLAVRLPAVVCGTLLLISLYVLTTQVFQREGLATAVVAQALTFPLVAAGSTLMTIDAPYTCCWGWALVLGYHALRRDSSWTWFMTGLVVGLGILAKYTMVLWIPSLVLFLLVSAGRRRVVLRRGFWIMTVTAATCCLPIVLWNAHHGWVSLRHVGGHSGWGGPGAGVRWVGPFAYIGQQFLLLLGFWFVAWVAAMWAHRPGIGSKGQKSGATSQISARGLGPDRGTTAGPRPAPMIPSSVGVQYLWWMSAPTFIFFLLFSIRTREQANWPVTAYLSGLVLTVAWIAQRLQAPSAALRRFTLSCLAAACCLGLLANGFVHHSEWMRPMLAYLAGPASADQPTPLRRVDPTCRLRGWRTLAAVVDQVRERLRTQGVEAALAGSGWTIPGELAFYCLGHPPVYSFGLALGDRHSQYDLWRPNPLADCRQFVGRSFLVVGQTSAEALREAFVTVEEPVVVTHYEADKPLARWTVIVCHGYRGFRQATLSNGESRF